MDHMMPEMDGIDTTAFIRAMGENDPHYKEVPIIALTANTVSGSKEMFLAHDFSDFLSKPIDMSALNTILKKWIPTDKQIASNAGSIISVSEHADINIKGIDSKKGIAMTGGTAANYLKILSTYRDDGFIILEDIRICLGDNNIPKLTSYAHAIKSASESIGASALSRSAGALEKAGLENNTGFIHKNIGAFLAELETLLFNIRDFLLSEDDEPEIIPIDADALKIELLVLKAAFGDFDTPVINATLKNFQKYTNDPEIGSSIEKIQHYKLTGDYDEAEQIIDKLLKGVEQR